MPSTSKKQHKFMEAVAHNPSFAKRVGVPQSVGQDFASADKGRKFSKGGDTMAKMNAGMMAMMAKKKAGTKAEMPMKKMASGGLASGHKSADGIASKGKTKGTMIKMNKGGMAC
jgi:hypothetical protein